MVLAAMLIGVAKVAVCHPLAVSLVKVAAADAFRGVPQRGRVRPNVSRPFVEFDGCDLPRDVGGEPKPELDWTWIRYVGCRWNG